MKMRCATIYPNRANWNDEVEVGEKKKQVFRLLLRLCLFLIFNAHDTVLNMEFVLVARYRCVVLCCVALCVSFVWHFGFSFSFNFIFLIRNLTTFWFVRGCNLFAFLQCTSQEDERKCTFYIPFLSLSLSFDELTSARSPAHCIQYTRNRNQNGCDLFKFISITYFQRKRCYILCYFLLCRHHLLCFNLCFQDDTIMFSVCTVFFALLLLLSMFFLLFLGLRNLLGFSVVHF